MRGTPAAVGAARWHAVDERGLDLATGRPSGGAGALSPAGALAAVPVPAWPVRARAADGRSLAVADVLGPGGARVEQVLDRLSTAARPPDGLAVAALARATPAGPVDLPVVVVGLAAAVQEAAAVDRAWLGLVEARRAAPRAVLVARGRELELEAALNLTMLVGTEDVAAGEAARVASGGRLWLLGGAVAWALLDEPDDPFAPWAELLSYGLWPVGPVDDRLLLCEPAVDLRLPRRVSTARTEA